MVVSLATTINIVMLQTNLEAYLSAFFIHDFTLVIQAIKAMKFSVHGGTCWFSCIFLMIQQLHFGV